MYPETPLGFIIVAALGILLSIFALTAKRMHRSSKRFLKLWGYQRILRRCYPETFRQSAFRGAYREWRRGYGFHYLD